MISTKDLSGLPNAERLKNFCKGLAALDIIMVEEEWSFIRHYTYNPAWRKGKEAFFATDGSDQSMIVMFAPEGCVINGVDSELYDWEEKLPRIEDLTDGMPPALQKLMGSREVKKMKSTFCVWTEDGSTWHCNPMDEDASKDLLSTIDGNPQSYVDYGKWFYPADLPLETVRQLADGVPVTKELITALNPKRSEWEEIKAGLDKIGYPGAIPMKAFDPNYKLLDEMYQDDYYPAFLVDKVKDELQKVIDLLESGETDTEVVQEKLDEAVCGINDLQEEFDENDSEIETVARDCIGVTVDYILKWFGIPIDMEEAIRERDW